MAYYINLYHAIDMCNAGISCSSLEVGDKGISGPFVSFGDGGNATKRN
jgi:hypothetical protein